MNFTGQGARSGKRRSQRSEVGGQRTGKKLKAESSKVKGKERRTEDGEGQRSEVRGPEGGRGGKIRRLEDAKTDWADFGFYEFIKDERDIKL